MFYPPKGLADTCRGPIVFTNFLFWVTKTLEAFQLRDGFLPKKIPENVLSPKGRLLADSCTGPIIFTYVLFWVSKTLEAFQFRDGFLPKKNP